MVMAVGFCHMRINEEPAPFQLCEVFLKVAQKRRENEPPVSGIFTRHSCYGCEGNVMIYYRG